VRILKGTGRDWFFYFSFGHRKDACTGYGAGSSMLGYSLSSQVGGEAFLCHQISLPGRAASGLSWDSVKRSTGWQASGGQQVSHTKPRASARQKARPAHLGQAASGWVFQSRQRLCEATTRSGRPAVRRLGARFVEQRNHGLLEGRQGSVDARDVLGVKGSFGVCLHRWQSSSGAL